jgi:hypothetical protein
VNATEVLTKKTDAIPVCATIDGETGTVSVL